MNAPPAPPHAPYPTVAPLPANAEANEPKTGGAKGVSLLIALAINGLLLAALAWWTIVALVPNSVELVVEAGTTDARTTIDKKEFQQRQINKPQPPSGGKAPPVIASTVADPTATFVMPSQDMPDEFGLGDGWGAGSGFGSGMGAGGSVGFFGSRSMAQRACFIIDVSASLNNAQFALIKSELEKSLNALSPTFEYQVIFFSGPAWFAAATQTGKSKSQKRIVEHEGQKYEWKTHGGASQYYLVGKKKLYTAKWISAKPSNIKKTLKRVEEVQRSFGTDWRHPLQMALEMNPKPDVVFFLTDGAVSNGQQAVDMVLKLNRRSKPKSKINTIVMMQPRAEDLLGELADKTGGEFTVVKADGSVERPKRR